MINYTLKFSFALLGIAIFLMACDKKQKDSEQISTLSSYTLGVNDGGLSYAAPANDLEKGNIIVTKTGVRIDATSLISCGNFLYFYNRKEKSFHQYELDPDGSIAQKASLQVGPFVSDWAYSQNLIDDNTILVLDPVKWGEPEVRWFAISIPEFVVSSSGTFNLPTKEQSSGVNWKSNIGTGRIHGNKFIMGTVYYDFNGSFAPGAHVVAFDFPAMTNPTLISTNLTTAELGIYSTNALVTTANGDLYLAASRGALWGAKTNSNVYGGILRIKAGQEKFDENYFFDLSKAIGAPANILQLDHLGGTSAMAILFDDTMIKGWGDIANDHYFFAKLDLPSQTLTKYNIPKSDAHSAKRPLITEHKYITFLKSTANKTTNILEIDVNGDADAFKKGTLIVGKNVKGYSITKHPDKHKK